MSDEKPDFASLMRGAEDQLESLKQQYRERFGSERPVAIVPYMGYGSARLLRVSGRVLVNPGDTTYRDNKDLWDNLGDMYRRFENDALPFPEVRGQFAERFAEATGDEEGLFRLEIGVDGWLDDGLLWQDVELVLVDQTANQEAVRAVGKVMVTSPRARFGVISDIDDTVIASHAKDFLKMARTVILGDAKARTPFPGVAAFYRALHAGMNPLFYVSSSPWNMYDLFVDLFELRGIPLGPFFLRDWGIKPREYMPRDHQKYKMKTIRKIMDFYPHLPFILIGDSGQEDPEIYSQLITSYPGRIQAVYIRHVAQDEARGQEVGAMAQKAHELGTPIILTGDTLPMAEHAASKGWISNQDAAQIAVDLERRP